jgi:copper resistance protein D
MLDPLISARAIHFASSIMVGGAAIFSAFAAPSLSEWDGVASAHAIAGRQLRRFLLAALLFAVGSGALWLVILASSIGQSSMAEAITDGTVWSVFTETQFGRVWECRLLLAAVLSCIVLLGRRIRSPNLRLLSPVEALLAVIFVATLAWCGHAGAGIGLGGKLHLAGDALHLTAAAAWVGGLIPLLIFIWPRHAGLHSLRPRFCVLRRFSSLATLSVTVLAASGVSNTWFMTNGMRNFLGTEYGNLVLVKIALLLMMLGFGAANRYWLTPRLLPTNVPTEENARALRLLCASVSLEIALGLVVICVVAILGQLPPPGHEHHMG